MPKSQQIEKSPKAIHVNSKIIKSRIGILQFYSNAGVISDVRLAAKASTLS